MSRSVQRLFGVCIKGQRLRIEERSGCIFSNDRIIEVAQGTRRPTNDKLIIDQDADHIDEGAYCGYFLPFFGHLLTEFLPRFEQLRLANASNGRILVHPPQFLTDPKAQLSRSVTVKQFLREIDLPFDQLYFCIKDTFVKNLLYTKDLIRLNRYIEPEILEISSSLNSRYEIPRNGRKVFLSRSRLADSKRKSKNCKEVDELFLKEGFEVFHPQEMTIRDQILNICSASTIAGEEGSALHISIFNPFIRDCIIIDSGRLKNSGIVSGTQSLLNGRLGCKTIYCRAENCNAVESEGTFSVGLPVLAEVIKSLGKPMPFGYVLKMSIASRSH